MKPKSDQPDVSTQTPRRGSASAGKTRPSPPLRRFPGSWSLTAVLALVLVGGIGLALLYPRVPTAEDAPAVEPAPAGTTAAGPAATGSVRPVATCDRAEVIRSWPVADPTQDPPVETARARAPRTEKDWQRHFLALARTDLTLCHDALAAALAPHNPLAMRVAALRVSYDLGGRERLVRLREAVTAGGDPDLRAFAVHFLGARSATDAEARDELSAFARSRDGDAGLRGHAVYAVLRWGTFDQIRSGLDCLSGEADVGVMGRAASALRERDERAVAPMIDALLRQAATPEVRHRLQEEISGVTCPEHAPRAERVR